MYISKFVNCTPHVIRFGFPFGDNVHIVEFPTSGNVARCDVDEVYFDEYWMEDESGADFHFPVYRRKFTEIMDLPEPQDGIIYIVSAVVLENSQRTDLVAPDSGKTAVRDSKGHILYVTRFIKK